MEPLQSSLGGSAEGKTKFFKRPKIIKKILRKIEEGEHLLISAPRRIGKTSILKHIRDNPKNTHIVKYLIVQSVDSIDELNKKLFDELLKDKQIHKGLAGFWTQTSASIKAQASRVSGISLEGVDLNTSENIDYYIALNDLFDNLKAHKKKIIIIIDEYPDALTNILKHSKDDAIKLLQQQREIREKYKNTQIQFIYTGSTGLKNVVRKLGDIHLVNNLTEIKIPPLSKKEAKELMQRLIFGKQSQLDKFTIPDNVIDYTLDKTKWLLPYFIQIIIEALFEQQDDLNENGLDIPEITHKTIDELFTALVKRHSDHAKDYFDHWKTRIDKLETQDGKLAMDVLNQTAINGIISYDEYYDLSVKHKVKKEPNYVLEILQFDGYLAENEETKHYGYNSVLLREWWKNNVAK